MPSKIWSYSLVFIVFGDNNNNNDKSTIDTHMIFNFVYYDSEDEIYNIRLNTFRICIMDSD